MTLLLVHAAATCWLAGMSWTVQLLVYPAFLDVGDTAGWAAYHRRHSSAVARLVALPWLVQGVCTALLLLDPSPLRLLAAALAAATVGLTVLGAVPLHEGLAAYDAGRARRLLRVHAWRTAAWTAGGVVSVVLLG